MSLSSKFRNHFSFLNPTACFWFCPTHFNKVTEEHWGYKCLSLSWTFCCFSVAQIQTDFILFLDVSFLLFCWKRASLAVLSLTVLSGLRNLNALASSRRLQDKNRQIFLQSRAPINVWSVCEMFWRLQTLFSYKIKKKKRDMKTVAVLERDARRGDARVGLDRGAEPPRMMPTCLYLTWTAELQLTHIQAWICDSSSMLKTFI